MKISGAHQLALRMSSRRYCSFLLRLVKRFFRKPSYSYCRNSSTYFLNF